MSTLVRNTCRTPGTESHSPTFYVTTQANPTQHRALELIRL
ncbi:hypothetical protein [Roseateles saccharophilus]|nr:hypothetical protein [Roseateles saccharophilus]